MKLKTIFSEKSCLHFIQTAIYQSCLFFFKWTKNDCSLEPSLDETFFYIVSRSKSEHFSAKYLKIVLLAAVEASSHSTLIRAAMVGSRTSWISPVLSNLQWLNKPNHLSDPRWRWKVYSQKMSHMSSYTSASGWVCAPTETSSEEDWFIRSFWDRTVPNVCSVKLSHSWVVCVRDVVSRTCASYLSDCAVAFFYLQLVG